MENDRFSFDPGGSDGINNNNNQTSI